MYVPDILYALYVPIKTAFLVIGHDVSRRYDRKPGPVNRYYCVVHDRRDKLLARETAYDDARSVLRTVRRRAAHSVGIFFKNFFHISFLSSLWMIQRIAVTRAPVATVADAGRPPLADRNEWGKKKK